MRREKRESREMETEIFQNKSKKTQRKIWDKEDNASSPDFPN